MSKRFLTPINLVNLPSDPLTGSEGDLYFNTTDNVVKIYVDGVWTELQGGAGGGASVIYSPEQPDVTGLETGTVWVDSDAVVTGGGGSGGTGGPSFQTIVTSPVSASIVAQTAGEVLTLISGENISIVNASANNSVTINSTGNYTSVDSIAYPDYITFDTTPEYTSASTGTLFWDDGEGTLDLILNENIDIGLSQEIIIKCYNGEATTLNKGEVVMVSGAQGERPRVIRAYNTSDAGSARTFGIVAESIANGAEGYVVTQGVIKGIDTNGFNAGDPLYLSATPGQLTTVKPQAPNHYVWVGVVLKKNSSSGRIYVKPQNGYELDEIHNVRITDIQNDDLILWNSASSLWINSPKQNIINTASAAAVSYLVDGAPEALNTLNELSAALNDDPNILNSLLTVSQASATYLPLSSSASFYRWTKTYSASASVISGVDDNSISLSYNAGYVQLFINGVMLDPSEYTATDGSTITVNSPVLSGEVVDIFAFLNSTSVNTYSQAQIDAKYNNYSRWRKTYSASATVISGVDDNNLTLSYNPGYEQLYLNGILLTRIIDYAVTDSSTITIGSAVAVNDVVEVINTQPFNIADTYTTSQADNTFLTQSSASTTYLTQANGITAATASTTYLPQSSPVIGFKNKVINGDFRIWQRGTSFSTNNVYTADRWVIVGASGQTVSVSQQSFTPGAAPVSGYEGTYFARLGWSGTPSGTYWFTQRIEDVRTFAGQTVTLSFWAKASSTTSALTPMFEQNFGSGGSSVVATTGSAITLTTSWQRFTQTFSIPSISGKTIGTNSYIEVRPFNGSTAVTGNSIDIWGVQVEKGSIATDFEERFIGTELQMCQRYYQVYSKWGTFWCTTVRQAAGPIYFDVPFRANPVISGSTTGYFRYGPGGQRNIDTASYSDFSTTSCYALINDTAAATPFTVNYPTVASVTQGFSAEL